MSTTHRTACGASERRRAVILVQLLTILPIAAALILVLGRIAIDAIYLQRVAAQHANLIGVGEALVRQLRQDACSASDYVLEGAALTLDLVGRDGSRRVTYELDPNEIRRSAGDDVRTWSCSRLRFEWRIEHGAHADVLWLGLGEAPPPRATREPPRTYPTTFVLPGQRRVGAASSEGQR